MSRAPLRIAVIGAGQIGCQHAARLRASPDAVLSAFVDPQPVARAHAAAQGIPWFPDIDALLASDRPDAAIVATPNQLHAEHGVRLIEASIPVLIEKPIADSLAAAERIVEAAERSSTPVAVGHHRRHNPLVAQARSIIADGRLGRLVSVHGQFWLMKPDGYFEAGWRRSAGAGPVLTNLIHDIDLMRHLVGEVESVQALQTNAVRGHEVDETTVIALRFACGALGTFNVSDTIVAPWSWEHTTGENPVYPQADQSCYLFGGTHGALSFPRCELWANPGAPGWHEPFVMERRAAPRADALAAQLAQFVRAALGQEPPLVSAREGYLTLRAIDAIQRAARSGRLTKVE